MATAKRHHTARGHNGAGSAAGISLLEQAAARHGDGNGAGPVTNERPGAGPKVLDGESFVHQLELELERAARGNRPLALLVGELDSPLNDDGRDDGRDDGGNEAAELVASIWSSQKRRIDLVAALGPTTFALALPDTGASGALTLSDRLRVALLGAHEQESLRVGVGVATFPRHGRNATTLIRAAGRALDSSRRLGRNHSLLNSMEVLPTMVSLGAGRPADEHLEALLALVETVDVRDFGFPGHAQKVGRYAELIAGELGMPVAAAGSVGLAATLCDVGKIGVPEQVLRKPVPLDEAEWATVRAHVELGGRLLAGSGLETLREWVLAHHERPDGGGYPGGLEAEAIPIEARVIAVADAYESMTSYRPYRAARDHEQAQAELLACSGSQFDRRVVDAFLRALEREGLRPRDRSQQPQPLP